MKDTSLYKLLGQIALEYRLSLKNICKLINVDESESTNIYNRIISIYESDLDDVNAFKYLFNVETQKEDDITSKRAYLEASKFLVRYNFFKSKGDKDSLNEHLKKLCETDANFREVQGEDFSQPLTERQAEIISKYRLKHCISRSDMARMLKFSDKKLRVAEVHLPQILQNKLNLLSIYFEDKVIRAKREPGARKK